MWFRQQFVICVLGAALVLLLLPCDAAAQSPWRVTLSTTTDPVPIGVCAPIRLTVFDPGTRGAARNPRGTLMSIADFDVAVTAPDGTSAAVQFLDAYHPNACACHGAPVGTVATVTATYPSQAVAPALRTPGVAFVSTATFTISEKKGFINPPECQALRAPMIAAASGALATPVPSASPRTAANSSAPPAGPPRGVGGPPLTAAPAGTQVPQRPAAAAPTGVTVTGPPLMAQVAWTAVPNATRYVVWRGHTGTVSVERTPGAFTGTQFTDTVPDPRITFQYTVVAHYADGTSGAAPAVAYTSPPLLNPSGFTATHVGGGKVTLQWQPVPGAARYRLDGPGVPNNGSIHQTATSQMAQPPAAGPLSWKVWALYSGNFADYATGTVAQMVLRVQPLHTQPWLTKNNGPGSAAMTAAHYTQLCTTLSSCYDALSRTFRGVGAGGPLWGDVDGPLIAAEAVYGNVGDLGFGRRTSCTEGVRGPPLPGPFLICYSTSHGAGPGQTGFADVPTITRAAAGEAAAATYVVNSTVRDASSPTGYKTTPYTHSFPKKPWSEMPRSGTVIVKDGSGAFSFFAFTPGEWNMTIDSQRDYWKMQGTWKDWDTVPALLTTLVLDSEGPKAVPHSCIACHGGRWDPATKKVIGASFLPLDPGVLVFGTTKSDFPNPDRAKYERSGQEENIRRINAMIAKSAPGTAVANYINGLYNGAVGTTGAVSHSDYVPSGWAAQPGLYRSVVKPFCASCHLAAPSSVNFSSWANFVQNKGAIYNSVCVQRTMPNAEIPYRAFWTKDTGPLYLPGLLAASLGYPSCP